VNSGDWQVSAPDDLEPTRASAPASTKRVLGWNMAWNSAGLAVETAVGFLVMPFLIKRLGESTYGIWMVIGALTSYFGLLDLGTRGSIGRHVALHHASGNRVALNQTVSGGLLVLMLVGASIVTVVFTCEPLFFRLFAVPVEQQPDASLALRIVAVQFALFLIATAFDAIIWGFQRFDWLNAVEIPSSLMRGGLTITMVATHADLVTLAEITLAVTVASGLTKCFLAFRVDPQLRLGIRYLSPSSLRELLGYGGWSMIGMLAVVTRTQLSTLLIGSLLGLALVTPFAIASRLLGVLNAGLSALTGVITPFATTLHATDQKERQRWIFLMGGHYNAALVVVVVSFLIVLGRSLIYLWIGPKFPEAALLLVILALGEFVPGTQYVTNTIILASARHRETALLALMEAAVVGGLTFILIPVLGLIGAVLSIALPAFLLRGVARMWWGCRVVGVPLRPYLLQAVAGPICCVVLPAGIVGAATHYYPPRTWGVFLGYGAAYIALFAISYLYLLRRTRSSGSGFGMPAVGLAWKQM
jgi:O-antigen/teichoic acid export membrane protein